MDFLELARDRYSCRKFDSKQITGEQLSNILEAGRLAPTAKNLQEQRIYAAQSAEALSMIDELTDCRYGAPTVLAVAYDLNNVFTYPGEKHNSGAEDVSIVATHMMLAAAAVGVDSCWINLFDPCEAEKVLGLPENEKLVMLLALGYAAEGAKPSKKHTDRKPLSDTVSFI